MQLNKYIIAALALTCSASAAYCNDHNNEHNNHGYVTIINPTIPKSMHFCGKVVDLDRMDMFERMDRELTALVYGHGNTLLTIKRANKYFPVIVPILKQNGVPEDVAYLACVESYLNQRAYSGAKAAGVWQFISSAATQYGLEVSDEVDERYNLEKATAAACRYLKAAYAKYGNWESAMASYNGGQGRISSELSKQGVSSSYDLYLTDETSRYVFRIMAMKAIMDDPKNFGFTLTEQQLYQPTECEVVEVSEAVESWPDWAKEHGITYAQLREENMWIRSQSLTNKAGKTYYVRVPKAESLKRSTCKYTTYNHNWVKK
jgi:hypothetical protein